MDLLANFLWGQKLSCNAFILLLYYNTQHGFQGLPISHACMTRRGKELGTTMRYTWGIVIMANQFPPDMRSIRSFSLTVFGAPYMSISGNWNWASFALGDGRYPFNELLCRMLIRDIDVSYNFLALVVRRSDNTLHWINICPVDNAYILPQLIR